MKVILPEHIGDIKLYQFQDYDKLLKRELEDIEFNKRKVCCFTDLKYHDLKIQKSALIEKKLIHTSSVFGSV